MGVSDGQQMDTSDYCGYADEHCIVAGESVHVGCQCIWRNIRLVRTADTSGSCTVKCLGDKEVEGVTGTAISSEYCGDICIFLCVLVGKLSA